MSMTWRAISARTYLVGSVELRRAAWISAPFSLCYALAAQSASTLLRRSIRLVNLRALLKLQIATVNRSMASLRIS